MALGLALKLGLELEPNPNPYSNPNSKPNPNSNPNSKPNPNSNPNSKPNPNLNPKAIWPQFKKFLAPISENHLYKYINIRKTWPTGPQPLTSAKIRAQDKRMIR